MENNDKDLKASFEFMAHVLLSCFWGGVIFLFIWLAMFLLAGDWVYSIHSSMFDITRTQFDMAHYIGMGMLKIIVIVTFLIPWICIKLIIKKLD